VMTRVCTIHVNPREEHDVDDGGGYYVSCCSTNASILVKCMESGVISLYDFGALFFWDVKIGKTHGVIIFLKIHGGISTCDDVRVEEARV
jgi:hypothetical protein